METTKLTTSLRETLEVFEATGDACKPLTTSEVTEQVNVGRRSAYERLERLVDEGYLRTKKVGARGRVWWQPSDAGSGDPDRPAFEALVDAVEEYANFMMDTEGYIQTWNPGARKIKGYEADEIVGEHFSTFYTDEDAADGIPERNLEAAAENGDIEDEGWRVRADGSRFWANVTITAIRDDDGDLQGFAKVTRDMTERREYEEKLRKEWDFTREVLETVPVGVVIVEPDGTFETANRRADELLGLDTDEPHSVGNNEVYDEDGEYLPPEQRPYVRVFETGESIRNAHLAIPTSDGGRRWLSTNVEPLDADDGSVEQALVTVEDVTQLKEQARQLERRRDELERELEDVFERIDDAFFAVDDDWRFTYVNEAAAELVQLPAGEMLGTRVWDTLPEVAEGEPRAKAKRAIETQESTEFEFYSALLNRWTEARLFPSENGLSVYFRDVTDRKERERELELYETIVEEARDGVYVLDDKFHFTMVNEAYEEMTGYDREDLLGEHCSLVISDEVVQNSAQSLQEIFQGEEGSATLEADIQRADGGTLRAESKFTGIEDADTGERKKVGIVRDVEERVQRERELEESRQRLQTLVDNFPNGAVALVDEELRYVTVGGTPHEDAGRSVEELEGSQLEAVLPATLTDLFIPRYEAALDGEASAFEHDFGDRITQFRIVPVRDDDGDVFAALGMSQDITERKERERELERYETVTETTTDVMVTIDTSSMIRDVNPAVAEVFDYDPGELIGDSLTRLMPDRFTDEHLDALQRYLDTGARNLDWEYLELPGVRADGTEIPLAISFSEYEYDGESFFTGIIRDISERKQQERKLEKRLDQQQVVADLGQDALETWDLDALMDEAARLVAGVLDNDYCKVLDLDDEGEELLLRQGVGWNEGIVGEATVSATANDSQAAYTLSVDEPVVVEDLDTETRFSGPDLLRNHDVRSGISIIIGPWDDPWGILGTHDTRPQDVSEDDVNFVQAVANILATAIERHRHEAELRQQREQLEVLNSLNEVVQDITNAVVDQSTREEIERAVIEGLADADSFSFAWIGEVDGATREVELRTEAGVEGYLDGITITADPDDERSDGPTGRALLTGETQATQDIAVEDAHDPWRDHVEAYGFRSSAAIPIVHEGTTYGVLNVYADRPYAFDDAERQVLTQLGEVVGHAIAAIERKRALMSDEVVELEFDIPDMFQVLGIGGADDGRVTLDQAVPVGDGSYLVYGTATDDAWATVESIIDAIPHWESVQDLGQRGDRHRFEMTLSEPPVLSVVASRGGYVQEAVIEGGDYHMTVHLPPTVDTQAIIGAVEDAYPMADLVAQRQISRTDDAGAQFEQLLHDELTERQRTAVEAAYHAGFFEWPRESDGEAVSESLGVSPPTFHQHLRKAEQKVFETLLEGPMAADEAATG